MKKTYRFIFMAALLMVLICGSGSGRYNSKFSNELNNFLNESQSGEAVFVWIYFSDKGPNVTERLNNPETFLTERAIERRMKRVKSGPYFEEEDLPIYPLYLQSILQGGYQVKQKSKWFNGVTCISNQQQLHEISKFDFVKKIDLARKFKKDNEDLSGYNLTEESNGGGYSSVSDINYGASFNQSNIINVPAVHELGYAGEGVLIAHFDAGVDNLQHVCFDRIRETGLRTFDFVNGDTIIANGPGRLGQGFHGTWTLSLIGGYDPGFLVSPAFNAQYLIAKTENNLSEYPIEEDNWIAAAEWADSLGADIITSSLAYDNFNPPYQAYSYTWEDMDGQTAKLTRAADIAVTKGIIVVNCSGNEGIHLSHNTLNAPADGFNVITVGAVSSNRLHASFSSVGPTIDGRIKPDVVALGVNNVVAKSSSGSVGYTTQLGTSVSTPMVAGVCAMMLSANPRLTPQQIANILRNTADSSSNPNNKRGWGLVNALDAVVEAMQITENFPGDFQLSQNFPNPFNPSTTFRFSLKKSANVTLKVYDVRGRLITSVLENQRFESGSKEVHYNFFSLGLSSGAYIYTLSVDGAFIEAKKMMLVR